MTEAEVQKLLEETTGETNFVLHKEKTYCTLEYYASGQGAYTAAEEIRKRWPETKLDYESVGGCDSCGYGELVTITFEGWSFPWE